MRSKSIRFLLPILLVSMIPVSLAAGPPDPPQQDVLRPAQVPVSWGFFLGSNFSMSSGTLRTTCDCSYGSGSGFGLAGGAFLELPFNEEFSAIVQASYDGLNAKYSGSETRLEYVAQEGIPTGDFLFVNFDKTADVSLAYLAVDLLAKWNVYGKPLYVVVGPSFGFLAANNLEEDEKITTEGLAFPDHSTSKEYYNGDLKDLYDVNEFRVALRFGIGYEIPVSSAMNIVPELTYSLPFTAIVKGYKNSVSPGSLDVTDWKHSAIQLAVRAKFWLR